MERKDNEEIPNSKPENQNPKSVPMSRINRDRVSNCLVHEEKIVIYLNLVKEDTKNRQLDGRSAY